MNKLLTCLFCVTTLCCSASYAVETEAKKCPCSDSCRCKDCKNYGSADCSCGCCVTGCDCNGTGSCGMPKKTGEKAVDSQESHS